MASRKVGLAVGVVTIPLAFLILVLSIPTPQALNVSLTLDRSVVTPGSPYELVYTLTNHGPSLIAFGADYRIEKSVGDTWVFDDGLTPSAVPAILITLYPGKSYSSNLSKIKLSYERRLIGEFVHSFAFPRPTPVRDMDTCKESNNIRVFSANCSNPMLRI